MRQPEPSWPALGPVLAALTRARPGALDLARYAPEAAAAPCACRGAPRCGDCRGAGAFPLFSDVRAAAEALSVAGLAPPDLFAPARREWRCAACRGLRQLRPGGPGSSARPVPCSTCRGCAWLPSSPGDLVAWASLGADVVGQVEEFAREALPGGAVIWRADRPAALNEHHHRTAGVGDDVAGVFSFAVLQYGDGPWPAACPDWLGFRGPWSALRDIAHLGLHVAAFDGRAVTLALPVPSPLLAGRPATSAR